MIRTHSRNRRSGLHVTTGPDSVQLNSAGCWRIRQGSTMDVVNNTVVSEAVTRSYCLRPADCRCWPGGGHVPLVQPFSLECPQQDVRIASEAPPGRLVC